jgi:hypothetical protein
LETLRRYELDEKAREAWQALISWVAPVARPVGKQSQYFGLDYQSTLPEAAYRQFMETIMDLDTRSRALSAQMLCGLPQRAPAQRPPVGNRAMGF